MGGAVGLGKSKYEKVITLPVIVYYFPNLTLPPFRAIYLHRAATGTLIIQLISEHVT
jgi:hypothetical protein